MSNLKFIYITIGSGEEGKKLAKHLLGKKLIGCANIFQMESVYKWEDEVKEDPEWVVIAKTTEDLYSKTVEEIKNVHPYEVPCITGVDADANIEYFNWISSEVKSG